MVKDMIRQAAWIAACTRDIFLEAHYRRPVARTGRSWLRDYGTIQYDCGGSRDRFRFWVSRLGISWFKTGEPTSGAHRATEAFAAQSSMDKLIVERTLVAVERDDSVDVRKRHTVVVWIERHPRARNVAVLS